VRQFVADIFLDLFGCLYLDMDQGAKKNPGKDIRDERHPNQRPWRTRVMSITAGPRFHPGVWAVGSATPMIR
jgi:hypothetical protein